MNKVDLVRSASIAWISRVRMPSCSSTALRRHSSRLVAGEPVKIPGFGQFKVRDRAARMARNPATGEQVKVPAKRVFKFLPAKALKEAVMSKRGGRGGAARKKSGAKLPKSPATAQNARKTQGFV